MKSLIIAISFLLIFSSASAQYNDENRASLGFTFSSFGDLDFMQSQDVVGAPSYEIGQFYTFGVVLLIPMNDWLNFEGSVEFKRFKVVINPASGINLPAHTDKVSMVDIPLLLRVNFLKYAFVNGGLIVSNSSGFSAINSSGIGGKLGVGLTYQFQRVGVFANPYVSVNPIISFSSDSHDRMLEAGIRLGLTLKL
ncbi:MAG TPA: hypothetical protein VHO72_02575 [Bacteroidales bacterium]|nr:hypothetical protein [Bacteroidales bacterium]